MSKSKKIILASNSYFPNVGGVENSIKSLSLCGNTMIFTLHNDISNKDYELTIENGVEVYRVNVGSSNPIFREINTYIRAIRTLKKIKKNHPNSLIIARSHFSVIQARLSGYKDIRYLVPGVIKNQNSKYNLRGHDNSFVRKIYHTIYDSYSRFIQIISFYISNKIFVFSNNMISQVLSESLTDRVDDVLVCKPGVDTEKFNLKDKMICRQKIGILDTRKIILGLGRFVKAKKFDSLIEIAKKIESTHLILLVGAGPEVQNYKNKINEMSLNNVIIHDKTDNPEIYYSSSDIFAMTSQYEPLGQTILEAQSCGLPIIAYEPDGVEIITAVKEVVFNDALFMCSHREQNNLIDTIYNATKYSEEDNTQKNLHDYIRKNYSWDDLLKTLSEDDYERE